MLKNKQTCNKRKCNKRKCNKRTCKNKKTKHLRIRNRKRNKKLLKMIGGGEFDNLLCIVSNNDADIFVSREIRNDIDYYIVGNRYLINFINTNYYCLIQITRVELDNERIYYNYVSNNELINGSSELAARFRSQQYVNYFMTNNITITRDDIKLLFKFGTLISNIQNVISEETFNVLK